MAHSGAEQDSPKPAPDPTVASSNPDSPDIFSQQYSAEEGGMPTEIFCPSCGEEISGSYLPCFRCPHCSTLMFRDERGIVITYEQMHTCPECERADLLLISDFAMPEFSAEALREIHQARERDCWFHALNIVSPEGADKPHAGFDREWRYDPARMGIAELNAVVAGFGQVTA